MRLDDEEVNKLLAAIALMATAKPNMVLRMDDPVGMAVEVVDEVNRLRVALRSYNRGSMKASSAANSAGGTFNFTTLAELSGDITLQSLTAGSVTLAGGGAIDGVGNLFDETNLYLLSLNSPSLDYNDGVLTVKEGTVDLVDLNLLGTESNNRIPSITYPTGGNDIIHLPDDMPSNTVIVLSEAGYYDLPILTEDNYLDQEKTGQTYTILLSNNVPVTLATSHSFWTTGSLLPTELGLSQAGTAVQLTVYDRAYMVQNLSECTIVYGGYY